MRDDRCLQAIEDLPRTQTRPSVAFIDGKGALTSGGHLISVAVVHTANSKRFLSLLSRLAVAGLATLPGLRGAQTESGDWVSLFDGESLKGWRASEHPGSFRVADGLLLADGPRAHLFYEGPVHAADFRNFEFQAEVRAAHGANSGIYFHTAYQESGWPAQGFEVQINHTATGEGGYVENKKTGSLYGVRNLYQQIVPDDAWFPLSFAVRGPRVTVRVNDLLVVDYVETGALPSQPGRRLSHGTFALQGHDAGSRVAFRNLRVRPLPDDLPALAADDPAPYRISPDLAELYAENYPVVDLHTHLKGGLTMADGLQRFYRTGINAGVAVNCGLGFAITNDAGIDRALQDVRQPLVFAAMQAEGREWVELFSLPAVARFDYVFTDAMTIFDRQGRRMRLWIKDEVEVGDPQAFMDLLVAQTVGILEREPVDILVNPTYLPEVIAADYDRLWTPERMQRVIDAAVKAGVAIEINDRFRLPSAAFIKRAKQAGLKFTFGTNNGGREDLKALEHSVAMVKECHLQWQDFWVPGRKPSRAQIAVARGR